MQIGSVQGGSLGFSLQSTQGSKGLRFDYHDPADTNQDGFVSAVEAQAYALKHPEVELLKSLRTPRSSGEASLYTRQGSAAGVKASGLLDLYA